MEMVEGEFVNTGKQRGTRPENSGAWSDWAVQRISEMRVLHTAGLSGRENDWGNVIEHSLVVNATAIFLAEALAQAGVQLDIPTIDEASLLHDAAKRRDKEKGISYADEHKASDLPEILTDAGYPSSVINAAESAGRTILMRASPDIQQAIIPKLPLEELIVAYADARVCNTNIVSLEEARDHNKAKVPTDADIYDSWYVYYKNIEDFLLAAVGDPDFTPQSINDKAVTAMVVEAASH